MRLNHGQSPRAATTDSKTHATGGADRKTSDKGVSISSLEAKERMKGMEFNDEWQDDDIPGMPVEESSSDSDGSQDSYGSGNLHPVRPKSLSTENKPKRKIKANLNILEDEEGISVNSDDENQESTEVKKTSSPDDLEVTAIGELEWENDTPIKSPAHPLPVYSAEEESEDTKCWKSVDVGGKKYQMDLKVIEPYKKVLSHGGYYGDGLNAIIVFCGCYLPDRNRKDYKYVMDNLFLYVISTLETLVAEDYMIIYFHGATPRRQMPGFSWLKRCYQMIDRRLKKNLKALLLVHPTLWLKTVVLMTRPFISSKFSSKLKFVRNLTELSHLVPMEYVFLPDQIREYDERLERRSSSSTPSTPSSPPLSPR